MLKKLAASSAENRSSSWRSSASRPWTRKRARGSAGSLRETSTRRSAGGRCWIRNSRSASIAGCRSQVVVIQHQQQLGGLLGQGID